ncbi:hypothetical protein [Chryseobacterium indologenes]|uniref:hypothetical protein n=1 Tax=Chryseobacterium indologenes TaxID=253 RepID=UPI0016269085|nr:hypothetical protein [Chryseobacterium indologenes]
MENSKESESLKPRELNQKVLLDHDSEKEVEQFVSYDPVDKWICLTHDGNEISMSLENYFRLIKLAENVLNE